jgi:signal-transduction protein with cAMP-binding, CBS, and nucleotidyltransferase domain
LMAKKSIGSVLVGDEDRVLGIFSERDLLVKIVAKGIDAKKAKVKDYMTQPVMAVDINFSLFDAQEVMADHHIRRLPITNNGRVVGVVSARNIMENLRYEYLRRGARHSERIAYSSYW